MAEQDDSRVMLPGVRPRKQVVPGPNSWAHSQQEEQRFSNSEQSDVVRVTNREKYEHKPMPPPPADSSPHKKQPQAQPCIQPAIPLVNSVPKLQSQQRRAVTDPIAPKPLFASRKLSVAKLRKKYSFSKAKDDVPEAEAVPRDQLPPAIRLSSEKAAEGLALYPPPEKKPNLPPAPVPELLGPSPGSTEGTASLARLVQSTPVPTRRYLKENGLPTPIITEASTTFNPQGNEDSQYPNGDRKEEEGGVSTPGMLYPPRIGRYYNVGEVELVEANRMHRVESFSGVIENAESTMYNNGQMYAGSTGAPSPLSMTQALNTGDLLPPAVYSPSIYNGVWENDPAVGYSLPLFSPMPNGPPPNNETDRKGPPDNRGISMMSKGIKVRCGTGNDTDLYPDAKFSSNTDSTPKTDRSLEYHHSFPSANTGVSGNSFASTNAPLSAVPLPSWSNGHSSNSVPSPPHNQRDYQRPGSVSAAMARLELTLHHHIDSNNGTLSRLIIDKHDKLMDQTIRRLEDLEETVSKGFRNLKADLKDIRKDIGSLREEFEDAMNNSGRFQEVLKGIDGKLEVLKKCVQEHSCKCQLAVVEQGPNESASQQGDASHRRTESSHGALGLGEQRQRYRSGASRSSTSARHSGNSDRAHRSNTIKKQLESGTSDEIDTRREYFAELGAARGPMPDLRDHPAYSGKRQGQDHSHGHEEDGKLSILNGLPYEHPSLSDGRWYQQAYGQNQ